MKKREECEFDLASVYFSSQALAMASAGVTLHLNLPNMDKYKSAENNALVY